MRPGGFKRTFTALLALLAATGNARSLPPRPNFIVIVSDDQGFDLNAFGAHEFVTPHLDRMAAEGIRGTNFYVTASICTPSRSGLITGRYPQRNGTYDLITNPNSLHTAAQYAISPEMTLGLDVREKTFGDPLKATGYANAVIGKWDLGQARRFLPLQRGFDYFYGHGNNGIDYFNHDRYGAASMFRNNELHAGDRGMYATDLFRREAIAFVRRNQHQPFFLYLPFNAPHGASGLAKKDDLAETWQVPDAYLKKYYPGRDPKSSDTKYAAMISAMDEAIGAIFDTLRELQLDRKTLVLFFSDNGRKGGKVNGVALRGGKGDGFEGGVRVPLIAWWPGVIPAGRTTDAFLSSLEILPTLVAAADAFLPDVKLDGFDMLPVLRGLGRSPRREMFWELAGRHQAARVEQFKWVSAFPKGKAATHPPKEELFDLSRDPGERQDLAAQYPAVLREVREKFFRWRAEMEAAEPRGPFRNY